MLTASAYIQGYGRRRLDLVGTAMGIMIMSHTLCVPQPS